VSLPEHEIIGLITATEIDMDAANLQFAAPDHLYFIVKPDALPPQWQQVAAQIVETTGNVVYGALARVTDARYDISPEAQSYEVLP